MRLANEAADRIRRRQGEAEGLRVWQHRPDVHTLAALMKQHASHLCWTPVMVRSILSPQTTPSTHFDTSISAAGGKEVDAPARGVGRKGGAAVNSRSALLMALLDQHTLVKHC